MFWLVPALTLLHAAPQANVPKPVLAVFDLEFRGQSAEATTAENLTIYLAARLSESGFQVIPRDDLKRVIRDQKAETYKECYSQSCQIDVGKELAASKTVSTQVLRIASTCQITSVIFDLTTAATDRAATAEAGCDEGALLAGIKEIAQKLGAASSAPAPAPAANAAQPARSEPLADVKVVAVAPPASKARPDHLGLGSSFRVVHEDLQTVIALSYGHRWSRYTSTLAGAGGWVYDTEEAGPVLWIGQAVHFPLVEYDEQEIATAPNEVIELFAELKVEVAVHVKNGDLEDVAVGPIGALGLRLWWFHVEGVVGNYFGALDSSSDEGLVLGAAGGFDLHF